MTRTTTISDPDSNGMVDIESREQSGDVWVRLKFRWLAKGINTPDYNEALTAHHKSMDYLMSVSPGDIPTWAKEKPAIMETHAVSRISEAAKVAEEAAPAKTPNVMRDAYRERGL